MKYILTLSLILLLMGCSQQEQEKKMKFSSEEITSLGLDATQQLIVDENSTERFELDPFLKEREFSILKKVKTIHYLPLETTNESLISNIEQIIISDNHLYISNDNTLNNVLIFDKQGKYLNRIQKGEGPEEILNLKSIVYDSVNHELIIYHNKYLSFFSPEGKFIRKEKIPLNAHSFTLLPDGYLFYALNGVDNTHLGSPGNSQILITDKLFKLKNAGFPYRFSEKLNFGGKGIHYNSEEINLTFSFINTVYQWVSPNRLKAKYKFDFDDKRIPDDLLNNVSSANNFISQTRANDYYYFSGDYEEAGNYIYLGLSNQYTRVVCNFYIDKKTKTIYSGTKIETDNQDVPYLSYPVSSYASSFVSFIQPDLIIPNLDDLSNKFVSVEDRLVLRKLREDDNPVLVFYELN
ncbi:6-bladed beta-propeller [Bacteroidales bacterium OttesenSCG-928-L03]|nr:6-bladed beta-propeller [Bacteroidales bacterium OttesenSCG-928-L03]